MKTVVVLHVPVYISWNVFFTFRFMCYLLYDEIGKWKEQLEHIYAHLLNQCNVDSAFRNKISQPKLGKVSKCFAVVAWQ